MSIYFAFDSDPAEQVASNKGWSDFSNWVLSMDVADVPLLTQLVEYGSTEPLSGVLAELRAAENRGVPDVPGLQLTIDGIETLLEGIERRDPSLPVLVTDGTQPAEGEE